MLLRLAVVLALAVLCLLLTSHWWLPAALPRVLALVSVEVAAVERTESGGLRLTDLTLELESTDILADWVELPSEWGYLRGRMSGTWLENSTLRGGRVVVRTLGGSSEKASSPSGPYLPEIREQLLAGQFTLERWLPPVEVGRVEWIHDERTAASAGDLSFQGRQLSGEFELRGLVGSFKADAQLGMEVPWHVELSHSVSDLSATLQWVGDVESVTVEGRVFRAESQIEFSALFGGSTWVPLNANAASGGFDLPEVRLPLAEDLVLEGVHLRRLRAEWGGDAYHMEIVGASRLRAVGDRVQWADFELSGGGDMDWLRIEQARMESAWVSLHLSEPLAVDWRGRRFVGQARMQAQMDLKQLSWLEADGRVEADLRVPAKSPETLHFDLRAHDLAYADYTAHQIEASGWLDAEAMNLKDFIVRPTTDAGDAVHVSGSVDFNEGRLDLKYAARLGAEWVNQTLGGDWFAAPIELEAGRVLGDWRAPEVGGEVRTTLQSAATETVELSGRFRWDGQQSVDWLGSARSNGADIETKATATMAEDVSVVRIESLRWTDPERPELNLEAPVEIRWQQSAGSFEERLSVSAFTLRGADMEAAAAFSAADGLSFRLKNVSLARIDRWLRTDLPEYYVDRIDASLRELRPFVRGELSIAAEERFDGDALVRLELSAALRDESVAVQSLTLQYAGEEMLGGSLALPLQLRLPLLQPGADGSATPWYASGRGNLGGRLKGRSSAAFSDWLEARSGLRIEGATLELELSGDLERPVGHVSLQASEVGHGIELLDTPLPPIRGAVLDLGLDGERLDVRKLQFSLNESALETTLRLPTRALADALQAETFEPVPLLRHASGRVRLDAWQTENWLDWVPPYLRRSGTLSGSFQLDPELRMSGLLEFEDFGLRPTPSLAAVDQISGRLRLDGRTVRIENAGATVGGSRVSFAGQMDFADIDRPRWFLDIQGENVPIRRTTDMILRSDLDLHVDGKDASQPTLVAGQLNLRSSTLLVDVDPLAPRLKKGSSARAPFFRITEEPFASWFFDLHVTGDRFMRVRSPYFRAQLSTDLELTGAFAEPQLLGSVRALDAELHFPGAKFIVNEGEAYIEASRPNDVQLAFNGIAHKASKVIVMEVSQTLEDPLVQFESTPPMSQADIVRLLATGSTTGGVGNLGIYLGQGMLGAGGMNEGFADKLTVDVGEETSRSGRNTLGVRYELTPRWSLEGEYDVFDAYNADLIWTIFKR